jgi:hypothetical protein
MGIPIITDHILSEWEVKMILRREMPENELGKYEELAGDIPFYCRCCKKHTEGTMLLYQEYKNKAGHYQAYNLIRCKSCGKESKQKTQTRWAD